jgi:DNA segregation ATPase FtsK/SpoIIIE-like protein
VVLDEYNAAVLAAGGAKGPLATAVAELGWRGRKFGVHVIFAAQDFSKAVVGRISLRKNRP